MSGNYVVYVNFLQLKKHKLKYLKSFWNILDMAVIVIALCCIAFNIYRLVELITYFNFIPFCSFSYIELEIKLHLSIYIYIYIYIIETTLT